MGGKVLGELEEYFIEQLAPGDTLPSQASCCVSRAFPRPRPTSTRTVDNEPAIPAYNGGKFPLSTHLAERVRAMLADSDHWRSLPTPVWRMACNPG